MIRVCGRQKAPSVGYKGGQKRRPPAGVDELCGSVGREYSIRMVWLSPLVPVLPLGGETKHYMWPSLTLAFKPGRDLTAEIAVA
jgi:hypothetical protein